MDKIGFSELRVNVNEPDGVRSAFYIMNQFTVAQSAVCGASLAPTSFAVSFHRGGPEVISPLAESWRALCQDSTDDEPFYRPEWIAAHARAFFPRSKLLIVTASLRDKLCLVLPLLEKRRYFSGFGLRELHAPVNSHSCRFDAVRRSGPEGDGAMLATWNCLRRLPGWDLMDLREIPDGGTVSAIVRTAQSEGMRTAELPMRANPCIPVPASADLLTRLPKNSRLRGKLRHARRELAQRGALRLTRVTKAQPEDLRRFYELETSGWKGEMRSAIAADPKTRQFYDEISTAAGHFGYLSMYYLELNKELLAAHLGLCYRGTYYSPKLAYNEAFKEFVPGHLIISDILADCAARGIHQYDITGPDDEWKMRWTETVRRRFRYFIFQDGVFARLAYALRFRLRTWVKRTMRDRPKS